MLSTPLTVTSSDQDPFDDVWQDIVAEREGLLAETEKLKTRNEELVKRLGDLERENTAYKQREERAKPGTGTSLSYPSTRVIAPLPSRGSSSILATSPLLQPKTHLPAAPPTLFDRIPNETLYQILGHLHQPFHFFHYSNALNGVWDPPAGSRPWNPVGLQLVNRRWRDVAKPLFYKQVAFDTRDPRSVELAVAVTEDDLEHPLRYAKVSVWLVWDSASVASRHRPQLSLLSSIVSSQTESDSSMLILLHPCHHSLLPYEARFRSAGSFVLGTSGGASDQIQEVLEITAAEWNHYDVLDEWPECTHANHMLILRLPHVNLLAQLTTILEHLPSIAYLPRLQLDFPFPLPTALLDTIFPTLTSILQHPSLPAGRALILRHTGNKKRILFGAHSNEDASELRKRIDALGRLEIECEVVVLDL